MQEFIECILKSDEQPTVKIKAVKVVSHIPKHAHVWCIYKLSKPESLSGFLYLVIEVYNEDSPELLEPKDYTHYHRIIAEPMNTRALVELIGIDDEDNRETLEALGIEWERLTLIEYGY